ncbi:MAG: methyltransferase domain-containing protein [Parvibaculaceae bacterium]
MTEGERNQTLEPNRYVPALRFHALTPVYDAALRLFLREKAFRSVLVRYAELSPGKRVLDFGCGTGTLAVMLKQTCPQATVLGLDIDPQALAIARQKAVSARLDIVFQAGSVSNVPPSAELLPSSIDCIISSLVFHHLTSEDKRQALQVAYKLLKPGGHLLIADWARLANPLMRGAFLLVQMLDGFATTADNVHGRLPCMIRDAGFVDVVEGPFINTVLGTLGLHRARKTGWRRPASPQAH